MNVYTNTELGTGAGPQLYDLSNDPAEQTDVALANPERVKELAAELAQIRSSGRSRP